MCDSNPTFNYTVLILRNVSDDRPEQKPLVIGVDNQTLSECTGSAQAFLDCQLTMVKLALFWIQLLLPKLYNGLVVARIYACFDVLIQDLRRGAIDAYPFELAVSHDILRGDFHIMPVGKTYYVMYTAISGLTEPLAENPMQFLVAPFKKHLWMCTLAAGAVTLFLCKFLWSEPPRVVDQAIVLVEHRPMVSVVDSGRGHRRRRCRRRRNRPRTFILVVVAFWFLLTLYSSHLKALLTQPSTSLPFASIADLAAKLDQNLRQLVVEDKYTLRWSLLTEPRVQFSEEMQPLYDVVRRRPSSLRLQPDMDRLCEMLADDPRYVFLGYEEQLGAFCGRQCVWRRTLLEYPNLPTVFAMSRRSGFRRAADLAVLALENYRLILIRRQFGDSCTNVKKNLLLIGVKSLKGPFALLALSWLFGVLLMLLELLRGRCSRRRRFVFSVDSDFVSFLKRTFLGVCCRTSSSSSSSVACRANS